MALGNDLDSKIVEIYQEYLKYQKDEKVENRVYASEESFRNGLEEVIKLNGIVDKSEFYTAIAFEIQNGNFSISSDGKIDLASESITKAVERAKKSEKGRSKQTTKIEENVVSIKSEQYKDLLEIKEVKTLEEARRIISLNVPNDIFDKIPDDVKKEAYRITLEESVGKEYAAPLAEIAVGSPKVPQKIDDSKYKKCFDDPIHAKAFKGFIRSGDFLRFADFIKENHPELQGLTLDNIGERLEDGAKLFTIILLLRKAEKSTNLDNTPQTGKKEEIDSYIKSMMRLSELTDEQLELYNKLSPLYTRGDSQHDGRFVEKILRLIKGEQDRDILRKFVTVEVNAAIENGMLKKTPELMQAVEDLIDNPDLFIELAEKTIEKSEQMEQAYEIYRTYNPKALETVLGFVDTFNPNNSNGLIYTQDEQAQKRYEAERNFYGSSGSFLKPEKVMESFSDLISATDIQTTQNTANGFTITMEMTRADNEYGMGRNNKSEQFPGTTVTFQLTRQQPIVDNDIDLENSYTRVDKPLNPLATDRVQIKIPDEVRDVKVNPKIITKLTEAHTRTEESYSSSNVPEESATEISGLDETLDATMSGNAEIADGMYDDIFASMGVEMTVGGTEVEHDHDVEGEIEVVDDDPAAATVAVPSGLVAEEVLVGETEEKVNETVVPPVVNEPEVVEEPKAPESPEQPGMLAVDTLSNKIKRGLNELGKKVKGVFGKIAGLFGGGSSDTGNNTGTTGTGGIVQDTKDPKASQAPGQDFIQHVDLKFDFLKNESTEKGSEPAKPKGVDDPTQGFEVDD